MLHHRDVNEQCEDQYMVTKDVEHGITDQGMDNIKALAHAADDAKATASSWRQYIHSNIINQLFCVRPWQNNP